ncbi:hypothetical protein H4683_001124 [Filibacter limicola]|uniref:Uncharacterized protein n=1 Tax=Sporosarcina limicola TaxID=34101 RepID=A0A927MM66_9BACL|nr:hypothetical protein [Sporosarcina limicola]
MQLVTEIQGLLARNHRSWHLILIQLVYKKIMLTPSMKLGKSTLIEIVWTFSVVMIYARFSLFSEDFTFKIQDY